MQIVTYKAADAFLLDDRPNWDVRPVLEASIPVSYERGLSGRESRRATGDTLRLALKYSAILQGAEAVTTLRNAIQALNVQPVLCPFWPVEIQAGDAATVTAEFYALFNADGSFDSIAAAAGLPFAKNAYPLMVGYLKNLPDPATLTAEIMDVDFEFVENDSSCLTMPAFVPPDGIAAAGGLRPLFPFRPNWVQIPQSGYSEVDVDRQQIGAGRMLEAAYYDQLGRRRVQQYFTLQNAEPFELLAFFASQAGEQNNFWVPTGIVEAHLTGDVAAADTSLAVDDAAARGDNVFVLLDDAIDRLPVKISGTSGSDWTLTAAVGADFAKGNTQIESLMLGRFDALKITITFTSPLYAEAQLRFRETPWETEAVAGETFGTTMGALPPTAILFVFTLTVTGSPVVSYFTGFERNLTDGANTYVSAPLEFDSITETASLERQSTTLKSRNFAGNPLALLIPFQLEWPLQVQIYEADVTGSNVPTIATLQAAGRCLFSGEVSGADADPPYIGARCDSMRSVFDRQIPRRLYQRTCNWVLFETACGLDPADWEWDAVVVSYSAATSSLVIGTITSTNGATLDAHYFAAGRIQVTHAGSSQYRMIGDSTIVSGGQMTLSIATPFATAPVAGDTVKLYPGCDGKKSTCTTKFNNYGNFGGFPYMPIGNPSVLKITSSTGGGGKK